VTVITNGLIVTEDEILEGLDLLMEGDRIAGIAPTGSTPVSGKDEVFDARGGYVTPGFIDIHSDYIEHMSAPRPTSLMDFALGLHETERELVGHGITTMFHSLSIYKGALFNEKPIRNPENVGKFVDLISRTHTSRHLIRHRFHARFEIDNIDRMEELAGYLRNGKVHLLSFMDHTPGQGQYRDLELYRKTLKGYQDLSDKELDEIIRRTQSSEKLTMDHITALAAIAREHHVAIASHDDDSVEKIRLVKSFGTTISEFPITMDVACEAVREGLHTIAGAPNVLLGGSHSGNLSAAEAIVGGCVDILCSDYYPAAMLHAVFRLHEKYGQDLAAMFRLVTINPARAVLMDGEIGSIREGKRGDLLIIEKLEEGFPVVTGAFVDGKHVFSTRYR
jgi:alpha-D-ribose 1-methylphosphonate 5-triphosphate diphosphatase